MIDPTLRLEHLAARAADPATAVLLLDVVLGHGAEPDPAAALAPALAGRRGRRWSIAVGRHGGTTRRTSTARARRWSTAGAEVHLSNAGAARRAVALLGGAAMTAHVVERRRRPVRRRPCDQAVPRHPGRLAPADGRAPRPTWRPWRADPRRATANASALAAMLGVQAPARRRRPASRGARPGARPVPARRSADRLGPRVRPAARRADGRRGAARGWSTTPRTPPRCSSPAPRLAWSRATTAAPSARWPAWSPRACGCSCCEDPATGGAPTARSTRGSARCCATAPTGPRC